MKLITNKDEVEKLHALINHSIKQNIPIFTLEASRADYIKAEALTIFGKPAKVVTPDDLAIENYVGDILVDDLEATFSSLLSDFVRSHGFNVVGATIEEDSGETSII